MITEEQEKAYQKWQEAANEFVKVMEVTENEYQELAEIWVNSSEFPSPSDIDEAVFAYHSRSGEFDDENEEE